MAKAPKPPTAAPTASATALAEPPRPQYVAAPLPSLDEQAAFDSIREQCRNASYSLLDQRSGRWHLLVFGGGQSVRQFNSLEEGIDFVRDCQLPKVRCLAIPEGVIR